MTATGNIDTTYPASVTHDQMIKPNKSYRILLNGQDVTIACFEAHASTNLTPGKVVMMAFGPDGRMLLDENNKGITVTYKGNVEIICETRVPKLML